MFLWANFNNCNNSSPLALDHAGLWGRTRPEAWIFCPIGRRPGTGHGRRHLPQEVEGERQCLIMGSDSEVLFTEWSDFSKLRETFFLMGEEQKGETLLSPTQSKSHRQMHKGLIRWRVWRSRLSCSCGWMLIEAESVSDKTLSYDGGGGGGLIQDKSAVWLTVVLYFTV